MTRQASTKLQARFSLIAVLLLCTLCMRLSASETQASRYLTGVRNSPDFPLKSKQLSMLLESLRQKSGFQDMHFDKDGFLQLGDRASISGGSTAARKLLIAAVDRAKAIDLENHNRTSQIAFARLAMSVSYLSRKTGERIEVAPIQIDFSDFAHLRGDKKVVAAFDIGFVVLHELGHAALGLRDELVNGQEPGECEDYINQIRRDLGVPQRQHYVAHTQLRRMFPSQMPSHQAELLFATSADDKTKPQLLSLRWDASQVGMIRLGDLKPPSIAQRSQSSLAP